MKPSILEMRLCERVNKIGLLVGVGSIVLLYVIFAIYCDLSFDEWRSSRFNIISGIVGLGYPIRLNETAKKILYWNTMFGNKNFYFGSGDVFKNCPGVASNCWATHYRSFVSIEDFDAVLIHANDLNSGDLPATRRDDQRYVFVNLESPENRPFLYSKLENDFFNLTMTYRLDSDIPWPYADVRELNSGRVVAPRRDTVWSTRFHGATGSQNAGKSSGKYAARETKPKSKTAIWFVSNCKSMSGREKYVEELAKHIDVDIYGSCGKSSGCPKNGDCFRQVVEPDYYFYLSFENSMCQDYVTEKLYNALKYNVVPVVYGGANYSLFAPPKSYINALDFASPRHLAEYLKKLTTEPHEYEKYFEWKKYYEVVADNQRVICQLCQYLHDNLELKSYSPLSAWYKSDKCPLQENLRSLPYLTKNDL